FTVLINEHRVIKHGNTNIILAGVTDYSAHILLESHKSSPENALKGSPSSYTKILLAHQPKSIYAASKAGFDLQLSGHTHGGQYIPFKYFAKLIHPVVKGLHKINNTWIYVSKGTGYWGPPIRLGSPSEITLIKLKRSIPLKTN
ncbi:MAG: metallophosphoesterase, partial [Spirochaetota bacterium]|nr:metallophosphoesterase [Spirochaetota bacterium]